MICRDLLRWLAEREAGRLDARQSGELASHLRECLECRKTSEQFQRGMADLGQAYSGREPLDLSTRILARLDTRPLRPVLRWALALGELAVAGILTLLPSVVF